MSILRDELKKVEFLPITRRARRTKINELLEVTTQRAEDTSRVFKVDTEYRVRLELGVNVVLRPEDDKELVKKHLFDQLAFYLYSDIWEALFELRMSIWDDKDRNELLDEVHQIIKLMRSE